jgi:hypothetical protein
VHYHKALGSVAPRLEIAVSQPFDLRSLPRPTDEQFDAFADHIGEAHSWYKHLPLLTGRQFVVFLAPDSGIGRLVARIDGSGIQLVTPAEGPVFTEENPRLHYSWKTSEEYRGRFGYLDYASRGHDGTLHRDVGGPRELPQEIRDRCTFTLYPYVSGGDAGRDAVSWAHEEEVERLRAGAPHPLRETILEWARLAREHGEAWESMTDADRAIVSARWREEPEPPKPTPAVERYDGIEAQLDTVYYEQLRPGELAKIRNALGELRAWLDGR